MGLFNWLLGKRNTLRPRRERLNTDSVDQRTLAKELHDACPKDLKSANAAARVIDELHVIMARHLDRGHQIRDRDWGIYRTKVLKARRIRTPQGRMVDVPERHYPEWRPSKRLRRTISRPGIDT